MDGVARVLVLEDDRDLAHLWRADLRHNGFDAYQANSNDEAMHLCAELRFDLIIADLFIRSAATGELSSEGGLSFIMRLRQPELAQGPEWGRTVPVLAVSGSARFAGYDVLEYARSVGADSCLRKPIPLPDLLTEVQRLLDLTAAID